MLVIAPAPVGVGGDASFYHSAANLIAQGHFYYRRIFGHAYPTALHPPLFSLVLSPVALLGGVTVLPQRIAGCVLGAGSVVLIAALALHVRGPRAARAAGAIAVFYPPLVTADGSLQSEPLYVLLLLVALLLAITIRRSPALRGAVALGAVIGLAALTRTEALLLLVLLAVPALWGPIRGRRWRLVAVCGACAIVLAPWVLRNAVVFHRAMLAGNYDTVIAGANCRDTYYGHDLGWWSLSCLARSRSRHQLLIGDASTEPGLRYAREHPARAVLVAGVRVLRTFGAFQPLRIGNLEPRRKWVDLAGLAFYYAVLLLAVIGLRRVRHVRWLLLAPVLSALISSATGWGNARFRIGADAVLVVLAGCALARNSECANGL